MVRESCFTSRLAHFDVHRFAFRCFFGRIIPDRRNFSSRFWNTTCFEQEDNGADDGISVFDLLP
jgi:hypothetical protein